MIRRFLAGMALTGAALIPAMAAAHAADATSAVARPMSVTANQCMLGGGRVVAISPTVRVCRGGIFDGQLVVG
jgi:hypothetical protein